MLSAIYNLVKSILCVLENLVFSILAVIIMGFNAVIQGIGDFISFLVGLLPTMPTPPDISSNIILQDSLGFVAWLFPMGTLIATTATVIVLWLAVQALSIALRWVKAIQ